MSILNYQQLIKIFIKKFFSRRIISCGVLQTPRFGRKISFDFRPGAKVSFECDQGFILMGDKTRECMQDGLWNVPEYGYTYCLRKLNNFNEYAMRYLSNIF